MGPGPAPIDPQLIRLAEEAQAIQGPERETFLAAIRAESVERAAKVEALIASEEYVEDLLSGDLPKEELPSGQYQAQFGPQQGARIEQRLHSTDFLAEPGDLPPVIGRYSLRGVVAHGGRGSILRVWDEHLKREVAVRIEEGTDVHRVDEVTLGVLRARAARLTGEARVTAGLDHPGIIPVHELGSDGEGRLYFTMRLVKGRDLRGVLDLCQRGDEGWNRARGLDVLLKACQTVAYAHASDVVHERLTPSRILVGDFGEVYVLDWSAAQRDPLGESALLAVAPDRDAVGPLSEVQDRKLHVLGPNDTDHGWNESRSTSYLSPELARGEVDRKGTLCDVYAMGAMLYELLSGQLPYHGFGRMSSQREVLARIQGGPPRSVFLMAPDVPAELAAVCERAMARDPAERYPDMMAFAAALRYVLEKGALTARVPGAVLSLGQWADRHRRTAASLVGGAALLLVGLAVLGWAALSRGAESDRLAAALQEQSQQSQQTSRLLESEADLTREMEILAASLSAAEADGSRLREQLAAERAREPLRAVDPVVPADVGPSDPATDFSEGNPAPTSRTRWDGAVASIADRSRSPAYNGLVMKPVPGLAPLGRDPASGLWEFWHMHSGEEPSRGSDGRLRINADTGVVLVLIPGGSFHMGAQSQFPELPNHDPLARPDEGPVKLVGIEPFFLSKYEMTVGQWTRLVGGPVPNHFKPGYAPENGVTVTELHPVEQVSWADCRDALAELGLTLPTEAQWEYAARGGRGTRWWSGGMRDSLIGAVNLADQAAARWGATWEDLADWPELDDGYGTHAPVDSHVANPFGLHHVLGNVWEWCRDGFDYKLSPWTAETDAPIRVVRGGGFGSTATDARVSSRSTTTSSARMYTLGVRPSLELSEG